MQRTPNKLQCEKKSVHGAIERLPEVGDKVIYTVELYIKIYKIHVISDNKKAATPCTQR